MMTRPDFLTTPGVWIRASRIDQTRADYACAVEHAQHSTRRTHAAEWVTLALFIGFLAALGAGWL